MKLRFRWLVALLFGVTCAVFAVGVTNGHLNLDDWGYTAGCAFVRDGLSLANVRTAFADFGHGAIWMPLTSVSYMADVSLFGGGWRAHHAVNVFLHAANAVLALLFLRSLLGARARPWALFAAALLWAVHPMRVEAVTWIASRKEELWTLFGLSGLLAWTRFCTRGGWRPYLATLALFAAAMLSKPTAVCLPVLAYLTARFVAPTAPRRFRRYVPMLLLALGVGLVAVVSQAHPTGRETIDLSDTAVGWRLLNAAVSLGLYVSHVVWPVGLRLDYRAVFGGWPLDGVQGLAVLAAAVLVVGYASLKPKSAFARRLTLYVALSAFVAVLPVLGLLGVTGDKAYADRYAYLPSVFLALLAACALEALARRRACAATALAAGLAIGEIALAVPTVRAFASDRTVYARVLADDPDHWRALRVLGGEACARENRMAEGVAMLRKSLRLRPSAATAAALAYVLACRGEPGDFAEVRRLGRGVAESPRRDREGLMLDALAIAAFREGDDEEAVRLFGAALTAPARSHSNLHAMLNFGFALANVGRIREALGLFGKLRNVSDAGVRRRAASAAAQLRTGVFARFAWQD